MAHAQQPAAPKIGFLGGGSAEGFEPLAEAFRQGLREGGYTEGKNVAFEYRWAAGQFERLPRLAIDLVSRRPAVIATQTLPGALAAKASTDTIPIVFVIGEDPIKVGLVASLNRPAGNVTGISNFMNVLGAKRLELVSEAVPKDARLALLVNPNNPNAGPDTKELQTAAAALGRHLEIFQASSEREIETAFAAAVERKVGALFINTDPFFFEQREQVVALAARYRVPTIYPFREKGRGRRADELWREFSQGVAPSGSLCRENSQGRQAKRAAGHSADEFGPSHQSQDSQGARP